MDCLASSFQRTRRAIGFASVLLVVTTGTGNAQTKQPAPAAFTSCLQAAGRKSPPDHTPEPRAAQGELNTAAPTSPPVSPKAVKVCLRREGLPTRYAGRVAACLNAGRPGSTCWQYVAARPTALPPWSSPTPRPVRPRSPKPPTPKPSAENTEATDARARAPCGRQHLSHQHLSHQHLSHQHLSHQRLRPRSGRNHRSPLRLRPPRRRRRHSPASPSAPPPPLPTPVPSIVPSPPTPSGVGWPVATLVGGAGSVRRRRAGSTRQTIA